VSGSIGRRDEEDKSGVMAFLVSMSGHPTARIAGLAEAVAFGRRGGLVVADVDGDASAEAMARGEAVIAALRREGCKALLLAREGFVAAFPETESWPGLSWRPKPFMPNDLPSSVSACFGEPGITYEQLLGVTKAAAAHSSRNRH